MHNYENKNLPKQKNNCLLNMKVWNCLPSTNLDFKCEVTFVFTYYTVSWKYSDINIIWQANNASIKETHSVMFLSLEFKKKLNSVTTTVFHINFLYNFK